MDPFAAHQHAAALRLERLSGLRIFEIRHAGVRIGACATPTGDDAICAGARDEGIEQHHLQIPAMNRELRNIVAGVAAGGLAVDVLAVAVVEAELAGDDGDARQRIFQSEPAQLPRGVGQDIDADTDRLQLGCGFEDAAGNPRAMQHQAEGQPADAGADDHNVQCVLRALRMIPCSHRALNPV